MQISVLLGKEHTHRQLEHMDEKQEYTEEWITTVNDPLGALRLALDLPRALELGKRYMQPQGQDYYDRDQLFLQQLSNLAIRYKYGVCGPVANITPLSEWQTPAPLMQLLCDTFSITKDRMSSPLTVHPAIAEYWTPHPEDSTFSAYFDSMKCRWTGNSIAAMPQSGQDASKAVRWALHSAIRGDCSTLTVALILHDSKQTTQPYMTWTQLYPHQNNQLRSSWLDFQHNF